MLDMIESQVLTILKTKMPESITTKYPNLNYTTSASIAAKAEFPCVYFHMLESPEESGALEADTVESVYTTIQIEVSHNENRSAPVEIAREILSIMKSLHFSATTMPLDTSSDDIYTTTARYRRLIAYNDTL